MLRFFPLFCDTWQMALRTWVADSAIFSDYPGLDRYLSV
jgi:environmental stress-induced protein Ves